MNHGRSYHTLTVLPDGKVFASGGMRETDGIDHSKAVFETEIWDPDTNTWTRDRLARQAARVPLVLAAAAGRPRAAGRRRRLRPRGQREQRRDLLAALPVQGPAADDHERPDQRRSSAQNFTVNTPDASRIQKMALVRMGSVTHNFDMDQRFMNMSMTQSGANTISVDAPTNRNVAIPGWYYMFAVDGEGVPSVGWIVKIDPNTGDTQAPTAPGALNATVADDDVTLNWNAATDNVGVTQYRVHRSTTAGFTPTAANRIATVNSGTSYADNNLAAGHLPLPRGGRRRRRQRRPVLQRGERHGHRRRDGAHRVDHGAGRRRHRGRHRST